MSQKKKAIRAAFRNAVFERDGYKCAMCGNGEELDAHHIVNRNHMPDGGYIITNGISLCPGCHLKAEEFHRTGIAHPGYSPEDLQRKIGST